MLVRGRRSKHSSGSSNNSNPGENRTDTVSPGLWKSIASSVAAYAGMVSVAGLAGANAVNIGWPSSKSFSIAHPGSQAPARIKPKLYYDKASIGNSLQLFALGAGAGSVTFRLSAIGKDSAAHIVQRCIGATSPSSWIVRLSRVAWAVVLSAPHCVFAATLAAMATAEVALHLVPLPQRRQEHVAERVRQNQWIPAVDEELHGLPTTYSAKVAFASAVIAAATSTMLVVADRALAAKS